MPELLKLTRPDSKLYETIDFAINHFVSKMKRQSEILVNKFKDKLNNSESKGFEFMQKLHNEFKIRVMNPIAKARYGY